MIDVDSAGVGRTGAFIAIDFMLEQAENEGTIDVFGLTSKMRKNRANMIQTVVSTAGYFLLLLLNVFARSFRIG